MMNERLKELARQSGFDLAKLGQSYKVEKFAELVIKETMQVVAKNIAWNGYLNAAEAVIEHFKDEE
jgi:methanogenic corrinoid protein MtbC1